MEISEADLDRPDVMALLARHAEGMREASPPGLCHFFDIDAIRDLSVTVFEARIDGDLAGCGALHEIDGTHGEVKAMRTHDHHLGRGVGVAILGHILAEARRRGYGRISLETGSGEPFAAAIGLYEKAGFTECEPFGDYEATGWNRYFTLVL